MGFLDSHDVQFIGLEIFYEGIHFHRTRDALYIASATRNSAAFRFDWISLFPFWPDAWGDIIRVLPFWHSPHEHVSSRLERVFSEIFPSERWNIVESSLASNGRHGNVMTIGEMHWSLSAVLLLLHQYQKIFRLFRWIIAAVNLNSQEKFYYNCASAVLRRLTAVSAELLAILEK